jgi:hypothetical protein
MGWLGAVAAVLLVYNANPQEKTDSAKAILADCNAYFDYIDLTKTVRHHAEAIKAGRCWGIHVALLNFREAVKPELRFCIPHGGIALLRVIAVTTRYVDARPDRQNELFLDLAVESLREEYPCKN